MIFNLLCVSISIIYTFFQQKVFGFQSHLFVNCWIFLKKSGGKFASGFRKKRIWSFEKICKQFLSNYCNNLKCEKEKSANLNPSILCLLMLRGIKVMVKHRRTFYSDIKNSQHYTSSKTKSIPSPLISSVILHATSKLSP